MAIIYSNYDGYAYKTHANWNSARTFTTGTSSSHSSTNSTVGISASVTTGRGGGSSYTIYRSFFIFDTSGINQLVESATLSLRGVSNNSGDVIIVAATSDISTITTADYDSILDWDDSGTDGSGGGSGEPHLRKYSDGYVVTWNTTGYNDIPLRPEAMQDMRDSDTLYVCAMNYNKDFLDVAATSTHRLGTYYEDYTGTSRDPKITYELSKSNAVLMGTNF
tara:strand:- start:11058 stop:11720 length:663 start_codon:yes stop_codon:yes gene_type:complete